MMTANAKMVWAYGVLFGLGACDRSGQGVRQAGHEAPADPKVTAAPSIPPEDALRQRAETFWKARIVEDWTTLYGFQDPSYREGTTLEEYLEAAKADPGFFRYSFYELGKVETQGDFGWVRVKSVGTLAKFPDLAPQSVERAENWMRIQGEWYPAMSPKGNEFPAPPSERATVEEGWLSKRFQEYFEARKTANYAVLYQFLNPEDREAISFEHFAETEAWFSFLGCTINWVEVMGDRGRVSVVYRMRSGDPHLSKTEPMDRPITENWVKKDGVWYRDVPAPPKTAQKE